MNNDKKFSCDIMVPPYKFLYFYKINELEFIA